MTVYKVEKENEDWIIVGLDTPENELPRISHREDQAAVPAFDQNSMRAVLYGQCTRFDVLNDGDRILTPHGNFYIKQGFPCPFLSGYADCACRYCMEIAIDGGLCSDCEEADCEPNAECHSKASKLRLSEQPAGMLLRLSC